MGKPKLISTQAKGETFTGQLFQLLGKCLVKAQVGEEEPRNLECYIVPNACSNILGRSWINKLNVLGKLVDKVNVKTFTINKTIDKDMPESELLNYLKDNFKNVFQEGLGKCVKMKAHLYVKEGVKPIFCAKRPVPVGAETAINDELDRLITLDVIEPVDYCAWAAPIVVVKREIARLCRFFNRAQ